MELPKRYYLPRWRSLVIGSILLVFGITINFIVVDVDLSFWTNLQRVLISFEDVSSFCFSLLKLLFTAGFIAGGYFFIKYSDAIERARIDAKGFHYREIPSGSRLSKIALDTGALTFTPYKDIKSIECRKNFWTGKQLYLTLASGEVPLPALGVIPDNEKDEIVEIIYQKITREGKAKQRSLSQKSN